MGVGFKEFFHAFGKALITAAEEMDNQNNDIDNQYNPYTELDNQQSTNSFEIQFQNDDVDNMPIKATEYEEFNQPAKRDNQDENDPENFEQNSQGENNFQDDYIDNNEDNQNNSFDNEQPNNSEDPDRQGNVRYVEGAHLVSRRQVDDGTYEELWIYNIDKNNTTRSDKIIKNILKGTDIPENEISSDDGSQDYVAWTVGNVQMIKVRGLPE